MSVSRTVCHLKVYGIGIYFLVLALHVSYTCKFTGKVLITINNVNHKEDIDKVVERYDLKYSRQILPRVFEYDLIGSQFTKKMAKEIKLATRDTIVNIYREEEINLPVHRTRNKLSYLFLKQLLVCSPYYGMHIMDAWSLGYRGEGVTLGVVDTGVEITHRDLGPNIDASLCHSFVSNRPVNDVNPDKLPSYQEYDEYSDHGNNCAGLIAAVQGNRFCSSGVAPNAKVAALKFLGLNDPSQSTSIFSFKPTSLAEALTYKNDEIHIYSNSHGPEEDFAKSAALVKESFRTGAIQGRNRKGSLFVIAAGNRGHFKDVNLDGYVNSVYTIAINSVGVNGTIPNFAQPGACIFASTYGEGLNEHDTYMVTTSHGNTCTDEFKGTSASAAIASGIIALTLQANKELTWRDVQHLIVNTSRIDYLEEQDKAVENAAGITYHRFFGFGILNASAMVISAKTWNNVPEQSSVQEAAIVRSSSNHKRTDRASVNVCQESAWCLSYIEHVVAYVEYITYCDKCVQLELCAPTNTCSLLLSKQEVRQPLTTKRVKRKWNFMSLQFWGEKPKGTWVLNVWQNTITIPIREQRVSILAFNLTVYGFSEQPNGIYEEIGDYASKKVDGIADVLDIDITDDRKGAFSKMIQVLWQIAVGAGSVTLVFTFLYFMLVETGLNIRRKCLAKVRQLGQYFRDIFRNLCDRFGV